MAIVSDLRITDKLAQYMFKDVPNKLEEEQDGVAVAVMVSSGCRRRCRRGWAQMRVTRPVRAVSSDSIAEVNVCDPAALGTCRSALELAVLVLSGQRSRRA
jgi:hypothetical protein